MSVFGRGVGECIVAHLGGGTWIVVDSHRIGGPKSDPVALTYLHSIGVPVSDVRLVAATHWDRDHINGLFDVVRACDRAEFWCTGAFDVNQLLTDLNLLASQEGPLGPGAREFLAIVKLLIARGKGVQWANQRSQIELGGGVLGALAPSGLTQTAALLHAATGPAVAPKQPTPNNTSVVLWFDDGDTALLFGADLETGVDRTGWTGVLADFAPSRRASVYKVAHHGSEDADHPDIWRQLLTPGPESIVTPFSPSKRPRPEDSIRLRDLSRAHFTGPAGGGRVRRVNHVERLAAAATVRGVRRRSGAVGHVRLRRAAGETEWAVAYGPEAGLL